MANKQLLLPCLHPPIAASCILESSSPPLPPAPTVPYIMSCCRLTGPLYHDSSQHAGYSTRQEENYINLPEREEPTYATIEDARHHPTDFQHQLTELRHQLPEPRSQLPESQHHLPDLRHQFSPEQHRSLGPEARHPSSDSLEQWQESYLEPTISSASHQPLPAFSPQTAWSQPPGQVFQRPFSQAHSEVEDYSNVLRNSSYALLSMGPKSISGAAYPGGGTKQASHFQSLPYIGVQVRITPPFYPLKGHYVVISKS